MLCILGFHDVVIDGGSGGTALWYTEPSVGK